MEKIDWTDSVRNEEILNRVKEDRNIVHTIKRRKANWIVYIYLLRHIMDRKIEIGIYRGDGKVRKKM
jgi:hypothetical protein